MDEHGDSYRVSLTKTQEYLDELYQSHIEKVSRLADGCPVLVFVGGDVCHGNDFDAHLCAISPANQARIAVKNLQRWFEAGLSLALMRLVVGTEAHTFGGGSAAVSVHDTLKALYPAVDIRVIYHLYFQFKNQRGQVIDSAHKGPFPGSRKWLKGNNAGWYLKSAMLDELVDGHRPPVVYARAHYHEFVYKTERVRSKGKDVESHLIVTPSYSGVDDYVRGATKAKAKIDHGLVALEFDDGLKEVYPFFEEMDVRTREVWNG